jgi:histidine triad (HIT) family protein
MSDCLFCRVAAGEVPAHVVHRTDAALAFLDVHPSARGHVLVVPLAHAATLLDLDDGAIPGLFLAVKQVLGKVDAALHPTAFHVGWNHGRAAGQHVFHLHVHVMPRFGAHGRGLQQIGEGGDARELEAIAAAIRAA